MFSTCILLSLDSPVYLHDIPQIHNHILEEHLV